MEMANRSVVVTGGASGIGRATARLLAREGALVIVGDIDQAGGASLAAEGLRIEFLPLDLANPKSVDALCHRRKCRRPAGTWTGW